MTSRSSVFWLLTASFLLPACSSTPQPERDPAIEADARERRQRDEELRTRQNSLPLVMTRLDQALAEYVVNTAKSENEKAERQAASLRRYLDHQSKRFMGELVEKLADAEPRSRAIAAAALGFSASKDVMAPLLNCLTDPIDFVRTNACLGLATLKDPGTPLDGLNRLLRDREQPTTTRRAAAWALLELQREEAPRENFEKIWPETLAGDPLANDVVIVIHALRGVGFLRDPGMLDPVLRYFSHPQPLVRQAALISAARCRNRKAVPMILPFLSSTETNHNVRLTARKALKAMTGNRVDHEYDLETWKKEFELGEDASKG